MCIRDRQGAGLGDRRIRHAAAFDAHAQRTRGGQGQAERSHPGDSASDRPFAARRNRPQGAWRTSDHARLRCAAGPVSYTHLFNDAQFLANAKLEIKVTRVDAFQLDMQRAAFNIERSDGITGHAMDHGSPEELESKRALERARAFTVNRQSPRMAGKLHDSFDIDGATSEPCPSCRLPAR